MKKYGSANIHRYGSVNNYLFYSVKTKNVFKYYAIFLRIADLKLSRFRSTCFDWMFSTSPIFKSYNNEVGLIY